MHQTHDFRFEKHRSYPGAPIKRVLMCIWCPTLACGIPGEQDPCLRPQFHDGDHQGRQGNTWPNHLPDSAA